MNSANLLDRGDSRLLHQCGGVRDHVGSRRTQAGVGAMTTLPTEIVTPFMDPFEQMSLLGRPYRILVTGWRDWPEHDAGIIYQALAEVVTDLRNRDRMLPYLRPIIVVEGACPYGGVDLWAYRWALAQAPQGIRSERCPARRDTSGKLLGPERNRKMVSLGADVALAFPGPGSRGTIGCIGEIINADIRVHVIPYQTEFIKEWRKST